MEFQIQKNIFAEGLDGAHHLRAASREQFQADLESADMRFNGLGQCDSLFRCGYVQGCQDRV